MSDTEQQNEGFGSDEEAAEEDLDPRVQVWKFPADFIFCHKLAN